MQIFHRLRRLAAALLLVPFCVGLQPVAAAQPQPTQAANVLTVLTLGTPPSDPDAELLPRSVRGDLLLANDGKIYFTSSGGGAGLGGVGSLDAAGVGAIVHNFASIEEGVSSFGGLTQASDGNLYGTTYFGGEDNTGTIFKLTLAGEFTLLHTFTDDSKDPQFPYTGLVQGPDGNLYGTTLGGGDRERGTIYRISTSGTFSVVHHFSGDDGRTPEGGLIVGADGKLYGTTMQGGSSNRGVIYRISTDGQYERLYSFPSLSAFSEFGLATNSTGANPRSGLMLATNGKLYGTAYQGGAQGFGTLYSVTLGGSSVTVATVHNFEGPLFGAGFPLATPVEGPDGSLYGTTERGGYSQIGAAWKVAPDGTFTLLHSFFGGGADGSQLYAGLLFANNSLYAVSNSDDVTGAGVIVKLVEDTGSGLPVQIAASAREITVGQSIDLTWNAAGAKTCDKFGSWNEPIPEDDPEHITPVSGTKTVDRPGIGIYTYALACTGADDKVYNAYVAVLVNPPVLDSVDGGEIIKGAGSLSWLLLVLFAALLFRKLIKENRSSCP